MRSLDSRYMCGIILGSPTDNKVALTIRRLGFADGSDGKEFTCNVGNLGFPHLLGWEDPLEEGMATHSIILA